MERYPVGSTAKGAAPGERLFCLGERKSVAVYTRLIVSTSSFHHDEYYALGKEISLFSDQYFRFIFVAKVFAADGSDGKNRCDATMVS
jgi:hypothetical protein